MKKAIKNTLKPVLYWCLFVMLPVLLIPLLTGEDLGSWLGNHEAVFCFVLFLVFGFYSAKIEAWLFHWQNASKLKKELHPYLSIQRAVVLILIWLYTGSILPSLISAIAFPFIHDGKYYTERNLISGAYPKKWFAQSKTSTALMTKIFTPIVRACAFVVSVIGLILYEIYVNV